MMMSDHITATAPTPNVAPLATTYRPTTTLPKLKYLYITLVLQDTAQKDNTSVALREVPGLGLVQYLLENKRRKKKEAKPAPLRSKEKVDQGGSVRGRVYTTSSVVYNTVTQETG